VEKQTTRFGEWLQEACRREGLSLRQAGAKAGLSHGTIEGIIRGGSPSADTIKKLARAFGGDGHQILALEDSLLILAGYRTERAGDMSPPLGRLIDLVADFDEAKLNLIADFADYLTRVEQGR
jgi:transcriptional regulator with XRE-family HTH domain